MRDSAAPLNWFLTELETGAFSVGTTPDSPGYYPKSEFDEESWVVPASSIDDAGLSDEELREAILRQFALRKAIYLK